MKSEFSGFHRLTPKERLDLVKGAAGLSEEEAVALSSSGALGMDTADRMIENVIGTQEIPLGIATNFIINGRDMLIPMALEEASVVAAASNAAKMCRPHGFVAEGGDPIMAGQIQVVGIGDAKKAMNAILEKRLEIIQAANEKDAGLVERGGGAVDVEVRELQTIRGKMLVVHLVVNVMDAMGANAVNTMCEAVAPIIEEASGARTRLKIITNLAEKRLARARTLWKRDVIGEDAVEGVLDAYAFALADRYRCATHNKGIMNGIDAVAIATSQDFRALEASAHAYACSEGRCRPLTKYAKDGEGNLIGEIELPVAVGTVGGASRTNPIAKISLKILGVKSSAEFSQVMACVGLAQNFAALKALSTVGIQAGHMKLHSKNIAIMAGAHGDEIERVSAQMVEEKNINVSRAGEILDSLRKR